MMTNDKLKLMYDRHNIQPNLIVLFEVIGCLEISRPRQFIYKDAISIAEMYIKIPDELKKVDVEFGDDTILGNPYWIKSRDFIKYMIDKYEQ